MSKIEFAECIECGCLTMAPTRDTCACGRELYPVSHLFPAGARIRGSVEFLLEDGRSKELGSNPAGERANEAKAEAGGTVEMKFRQALYKLLARRDKAGLDVWAHVDVAACALWGADWVKGMEP